MFWFRNKKSIFNSTLWGPEELSVRLLGSIQRSCFPVITTRIRYPHPDPHLIDFCICLDSLAMYLNPITINNDIWWRLSMNFLKSLFDCLKIITVSKTFHVFVYFFRLLTIFANSLDPDQA